MLLKYLQNDEFRNVFLTKKLNYYMSHMSCAKCKYDINISPVISVYAPIQDGIQSDSEGDDSLVSSEDSGSSSSAGLEEHDDVEDDLGVVRDLELDDDHSHLHTDILQQNAYRTPSDNQSTIALTCEEVSDDSAITCGHSYSDENSAAVAKSLAEVVASQFSSILRKKTVSLILNIV